MAYFNNISLRRFIAVICLPLLLAGCLNQQPRSQIPPAPQTISTAELPVSQAQPYYLQIGDVMDIKLMLNPELNDQVTVRPDGMISTTVALDVQAYGRTVTELQKDLESRYGSHLLSPHVAVILRSFAPTRLYVLGEVNSPGEFITVGPTLTLLQAIARAGGVKNSAGTDEILILRRGISDKPQVFAADYMKAVSGEDPTGDVRLAPFDVVYVPRSGVGNAYLHFQQYIQEFVPASFGLDYQLNPTNTR